MEDLSKLDRTYRAPRADRIDGHGQPESARPLNPWLLVAAGLVVVLLLVLFA